MSDIPNPAPGADAPAPFAARVLEAAELLEAIARQRDDFERLPDETRNKLKAAAGRFYNPDPAAYRHGKRAREREDVAKRIAANEAKLDSTGIRTLRARPVFTTPNYLPPAAMPADAIDDTVDADAARSRGESTDPRFCYVCKTEYTRIHHFYDQMCVPCGEFNFAKRTETADLTGRVALLTGGRVKIGYQAGLKLLRAGAHLIVTTRFPRDSAARYAQEPDFAQWQDRLEIFGLDLRHTPSVEAFCQHLIATRDRLDFIVNNACQTVRRPPEFYAHMMRDETARQDDLPAHARRLLGAYEGLRGSDLLSADGNALATAASQAAGITRAAELSQVPLLPEELLGQKHLFPEGRLDADLQQVDLRGRNSWRLLMDEVPAVELLEVQLVNAVAPFLINARLKALMLKTATRDKHIVNVSAVEGQFYRRFKTTRHPHTNMAKAALNMMTRTAAADYHRDGIHMNAIDTGWVTDEDPAEIAARKRQEERFHPPLDIVDGAARIVDPIIVGANTGEHTWGQFLKDYKPTDW